MVVLVNDAVAGVASAQLELNVTETGDVTSALFESTMLIDTLVVSPSEIELEPRFISLSVKPAPLPVPMRRGVMEILPLAIGSVKLTVSSVAVIVSDVWHPASR